MNLQSLITTFNSTPAWVVGLLEVVSCVILALVVHAVAYRTLVRLVRSRDAMWKSLVTRTQGPARSGSNSVDTA